MIEFQCSGIPTDFWSKRTVAMLRISVIMARPRKNSAAKSLSRESYAISDNTPRIDHSSSWLVFQTVFYLLTSSRLTRLIVSIRDRHWLLWWLVQPFGWKIPSLSCYSLILCIWPKQNLKWIWASNSAVCSFFYYKGDGLWESLSCRKYIDCVLLQVIKYESIIHEFDPYFNYRVTQVCSLASKGEWKCYE